MLRKQLYITFIPAKGNIFPFTNLQIEHEFLSNIYHASLLQKNSIYYSPWTSNLKSNIKV
jgi:hypothetical protein